MHEKVCISEKRGADNPYETTIVKLHILIYLFRNEYHFTTAYGMLVYTLLINKIYE